MNIYLIILLLGGFVVLFSNQRKTSGSKRIINHPSDKRYGTLSRSMKGKVLRSKGEKIIADWLDTNRINYKYERKLSKYVPDFYLPQHKLIIEYYGLRDAPGKVGAEYRKKIKQKRKYFNNLNVRLIEIYQEDLHRLDDIILPVLF